MPDNVNVEWFKQRIADCNLSQRKIAKKMKMDPASFSLKLQGKRPLRLREAGELAEILGVPLDQVARYAGLRIPKDTDMTNAVPIAGWVDTNGEVRMEAIDGPAEVPRPAEVSKGALALRIRDGGPLDGWVAYYVPGDRVDPDAVSRWSVAKVADGPLYLRVLTRGYDFGKWTLQPLRPIAATARVENVTVEWARPVQWIRA